MNAFNDQQLTRRDDEISISELAACLVVHRRLFFVSLVLAMLLGVTVLFFMPTKQGYSSLYRMPLVEVGVPLISPETLVAQVESQWLPELAQLYAAKEQGLPFDIKVDSPKDSHFLRLTSEAKPADAGLVHEVHGRLFAAVEAALSAAVSRREVAMLEQIDAVDAMLLRLEALPDSADSYVRTFERKMSLVRQQAQLSSGETVVVAREQGARGASNGLLLILLAMFSMFLAVALVVLVEFSGHVREATRRHPRRVRAENAWRESKRLP